MADYRENPRGREGEDDRSRALHTGPGLRSSGKKGRPTQGQVDAYSRPRTAPLAGKSLAGAYRPGAAARVGSVCSRWEPGYGWSHGESHLGGKADANRNT